MDGSRAWARCPRVGQALAPLVFEQETFAPQAAPVAAQLAVGRDHTVTGQQDRQAVVAVGATHGTLGAGPAKGAGEAVVGACFAVRNLAQLGPDLSLEVRAGVTVGTLNSRNDPSK